MERTDRVCCDDPVGWLAGDPFGRGVPGSADARTSSCARRPDARSARAHDARPGSFPWPTSSYGHCHGAGSGDAGRRARRLAVLARAAPSECIRGSSTLRDCEMRIAHDQRSGERSCPRRERRSCTRPLNSLASPLQIAPLSSTATQTAAFPPISSGSPAAVP